MAVKINRENITISKEKILIGFRKNIVTVHEYNNIWVSFSPHNLHILTLESGTVEINLAIHVLTQHKKAISTHLNLRSNYQTS
jgi:hypothetical protein